MQLGGAAVDAKLVLRGFCWVRSLGLGSTWIGLKYTYPHGACAVQKEIHEQPDSILQTMSGRVNLSGSHKVPH